VFDKRRQTRHTLRVTQTTAGQEWAKALVKRVGRAVKQARQGKSAAWLSDRTADLGYRISPTVIAKLDSGHRGEVLSLPELLILAAALDIPPALLIFPEFPHGTVELLPDDRAASGYEAVKWLGGERPIPPRRADVKRRIAAEPNVGTQLVAAVRERDEIDQQRIRAAVMAAGREDLREAAAELDAEGATVRVRIADLSERLGIAGSSGNGERDG
jgi:hypothetical protein